METIIGFDVYLYSAVRPIMVSAEVYTDNGDFLVFRNVLDNALVDPPRAEFRKTSVLGIVALYDEGGDDEQNQ